MRTTLLVLGWVGYILVSCVYYNLENEMLKKNNLLKLEFEF